MFSHIMLGANDPERMRDFYDAVLAPLGLQRPGDQKADSPAGITWKYEGRRWPQFAIRTPFDGKAATAGNGVQVSFTAPSRQAVDELWQRALDHGGSDEGAPGLRPHYADDFYGAYCRDPEGNKLCFVHTGDMS